MAIDEQPISNVQWVDPATLYANGYNPNVMPPPERKLLKVSILEDGWTTPIVVRPNGEIVDGFHRWHWMAPDPAVAALTGGLVPVVTLSRSGPNQMMSTIRHNRARGEHQVRRMAEIVAVMAADGVSVEEMQQRLGMEKEEVSRLLDKGDMLKRGAGEGFSQGWAVKK